MGYWIDTETTVYHFTVKYSGIEQRMSSICKPMWNSPYSMTSLNPTGWFWRCCRKGFHRFSIKIEQFNMSKYHEKVHRDLWSFRLCPTYPNTVVCAVLPIASCASYPHPYRTDTARQMKGLLVLLSSTQLPNNGIFRNVGISLWLSLKISEVRGSWWFLWAVYEHNWTAHNMLSKICNVLVPSLLFLTIQWNQDL